MVTSATAFGRSGLHDFIIQRVSAVILALYAVYLASFIVSMDGVMTQAVWRQLFTDPYFRIYSFVALLSLVAHAWIGLWTVSTDYIKPNGLRLLFQVVVILYCLMVLAWGLQLIWGL